jgi:spore coat polysaccharide biosynthesis protein SpsF (cytidylyltransferase family)
MNKKVVAIIQARMDSSRLPGKVLMPILGMPMLQIQIERLKKSKQIDEIIIATSIEPSDDAIAQLCETYGYNYYRGSLDNVLRRMTDAAALTSADIIIRITGDCPLVHYSYIDIMIELFKNSRLDYASNGRHSLSDTPDGFDVEIMSHGVLYNLYIHSPEYEHPTKDLWRRSNFYGRCTTISLPPWFYDKKLSVDTANDFLRVKILFETIGRIDFDLSDILKIKDGIKSC